MNGSVSHNVWLFQATFILIALRNHHYCHPTPPHNPPPPRLRAVVLCSKPDANVFTVFMKRCTPHGCSDLPTSEWGNCLRLEMGNLWLNDNIFETGGNGAKISSISHSNGPNLAGQLRESHAKWVRVGKPVVVSPWIYLGNIGLGHLVWVLGTRRCSPMDMKGLHVLYI